ncbi:MAG: ribonuclease J, partial [Chloroflexi bacterium]|nr:ribonuclease J [Chloroflexota bacterium]
AQQMGIPKESIFVMENGGVLEFTRETARIGESVPNEAVFVDGLGVGDVGPAVMREREVLARDGFVLAIVPVSAVTGEVTGKPELVSRGFVYLRERGDLMERAADRVWQTLHGGASRREQTIIERTQEALGRFFHAETGRKPMVLAVVTQV